MTISTSVGRQFTVGQIVTMAYKRAGLVEVRQTPHTAQMSFGRDQLELIIDELETYGVKTRAVTFITLTLEEGEHEYDLPTGLVDVLNPAKYIAEGESVTSPTSETNVEVISRMEWQAISARSATGDPTRVYISKSADTLQAWFWPIPDEAGTVRFMVERQLADTDLDAVTVDLPGYWNEYLVGRLASLLAEAQSMPAEKVLRLTMQANAALTRARAKNNSGLSNQIVVDHPTNVGRA
jgi:hypothetical protein